MRLSMATVGGVGRMRAEKNPEARCLRGSAR
jgi:hypothetical protein